MRLLKLMLFSVWFVVASCLNISDQTNSKSSVPNDRLKRLVSNDLDTHLRTIKGVPTKNTNINLVKPQNVWRKPVNQKRVVNPTQVKLNNNINHMAPKQLAKDKTQEVNKSESIHKDDNLKSIDINHNEHDNSGEAAHVHRRNKVKEHVITYKEDKSETVEPTSSIVVEEKLHHNSVKILTNSKEDVKSPIILVEEKKNSYEIKDHEKQLLSPQAISVTKNFIQKESRKNSSNEKPHDLKLLQKEPSPDLKSNMTSSNSTTENEHEISKVDGDKIEKTCSDVILKVKQDDRSKITNTLHDSKHIPLLMKMDNNLKLEGAQEIVIQNNNYEELYETNRSPQYSHPYLINSELRTPQIWSTNRPTFNQNFETNDQYVYDDMVSKYNQHIDNLYDGLQNRYNFNNYHWNTNINNPKKIEQWQNDFNQVDKCGRIWRTWRNNQVSIRPVINRVDNLSGSPQITPVYAKSVQNMPVHSSNGQSYGQNMPVQSSIGHSYGQNMPVQSSIGHSYGQNMPVQSSIGQSYGQNMPVQSSIGQSYGQNMPVQSSIRQSFKQNMPVLSSVGQSYGQNMPVQSFIRQSFKQNMPVLSSVGQSYGQNMPAFSSMGQTYGQNLPTYSSAIRGYVNENIHPYYNVPISSCTLHGY